MLTEKWSRAQIAWRIAAGIRLLVAKKAPVSSALRVPVRRAATAIWAASPGNSSGSPPVIMTISGRSSSRNELTNRRSTSSSDVAPNMVDADEQCAQCSGQRWVSMSRSPAQAPAAAPRLPRVPPPPPFGASSFPAPSHWLSRVSAGTVPRHCRCWFETGTSADGGSRPSLTPVRGLSPVGAAER